MEKREQDILKKIEEKTKDIQVPEKLEPEQMERLLEEKGTKRRRRTMAPYRIGGLLAACLLLAAGIQITGNLRNDMPAEKAAKSTTEIAKEALKDEKDGLTPEDEEDAAGGEDDYKKVYSYIKAKLDMQEQEQKEIRLFDTAKSDTAKSMESGGMTEDIAAEESVMAAADTGGTEAVGASYSERSEEHTSELQSQR